MAAQFPETEADKASWARLWTMVRLPWERTDDLAHVLGVVRSAVSQWANGPNRGPWSLLRAALRETARRYPESIPRLVEALAGELLDGARGRWVPLEDLGQREWSDEAADFAAMTGELHLAVRQGNAEAVERVADRAHRDVDEMIAAARQAVRRTVRRAA